MFARRLGLAYALIASVCFLVSFAYALSIPPQYTADATLVPKEQDNSSAQLSTLSSASQLLGLGGGGDQSSDFSMFQKYWGSRDVAAMILKKYPGLEKVLFSNDWDKARNSWYDHPHTLRQIAAVPLNWLFGVYPSYRPTAEELATSITNSMKLEADPQGDEVTITFKAPDAQFAKWFLTTVIAETDAAVRDAKQRRDQDFINFSRKRLERETNVSYREALTDAIRQFEISNMYSEAGANFSFQYIETPTLPINHSSPRPLLYTVLAFIFANLVAGCVVGGMVLWPESRLSLRIEALLDHITRGAHSFFQRRAREERAY